MAASADIPAFAPTKAASALSFYGELTRRRREGWLFSALTALVAAGMGIVLSAIVTPLILLVIGGLLHLASRFGVQPQASHAAIAAIKGWAGMGLDAYGEAVDALDRVHGLMDSGLVLGPLSRLLPMAAPAIVAAALVWLWLRGIFSRAGAEDLTARLGGREPNANDAEEHQLANLVEEMAIAAGAPTPRLYVLDSPLINAAAIGRSHTSGAVLVTRGLVDKLDRAETQAIVGRLVAAIGAGDLRAGQSILAVLQTFAFFLTLLDLPLRLGAWRTMGDLAIAAFSPWPSGERLARLSLGLEDSLTGRSIPDIDALRSKPPFKGIGGILLVPLVPAMLISSLLKLVLFLWTAFLLGPPLALLWRSRCYWSDAMTVRLGRDAGAFASALEKMAESAVPAGAERQSYLFVGAPGANVTAARGRQQIALALMPPIAQRVWRLRRMDADPAARLRRFGSIDVAALVSHPVRAVLVLALLLLLIPVSLALAVAGAYITAIVMAIDLVAGLALVRGLL